MVPLGLVRSQDAVLIERSLLTSTIAVKDHPSLLWTALKQRRLQRVDHQPAIDVRSHRPAHHLAVERIIRARLASRTLLMRVQPIWIIDKENPLL
jgi:ABC-type thiamine transport system ATPase subunit